MAGRSLRWLGIATLLIGYPLLAYYTNESAQNTNFGTLVALAPVTLLALLLTWRAPQRHLMLGLLLLAVLALWLGWSALKAHFGMVYWLQYLGMQLLLLATFARTLFAGRQPLCTRFAEALHPPLSAQQVVYTRQVTIAWSLFFASMAICSTLLFFMTSLQIWTMFAYFMTLPLVALMFIGEYWIRRRVFPTLQHVHILDAVRAFRDNMTHSTDRRSPP